MPAKNTTITLPKPVSLLNLLPIAALLGTAITAWVNLSGAVTQIEVQQEADNKVAQIHIQTLKTSIAAVHAETEKNRAILNDLREQVTELERTVTHLYTRKRK